MLIIYDFSLLDIFSLYLDIILTINYFSDSELA